MNVFHLLTSHASLIYKRCLLFTITVSENFLHSHY